MRPTAALPILAAVVVAITACGGGDNSDSAADEQEITALVGELNRITADRDAAGFCDVMQPSGVKANFNTRRRCVRETTQILDQAGKQPTLNIDEISVDGDLATVSLEGGVGELSLARENGRWFVAFSDASPGGSGPSGQNGAAEPAQSGESGSGG